MRKEQKRKTADERDWWRRFSIGPGSFDYLCVCCQHRAEVCNLCPPHFHGRAADGRLICLRRAASCRTASQQSARCAIARKREGCLLELKFERAVAGIAHEAADITTVTTWA